MDIHAAPLINTYKRSAPVLTRASGSEIFDETGKRYLDCLAGIAVVSAGHCEPSIVKAFSEQAQVLGHVSNLFWTAPMSELAYRLHDISGFGKVFFTNSGSESVECALKLARKSAGEGRGKIVCAENSFHGRTYGALAATGQPAKWQGFEPIPSGFVHCAYNDLDSFSAAVDETTSAVFVEPIQGEGGVHPGGKEFLQGLRDLCDSVGAVLIFDEIQCGIGRTGSWWGFQHFGVQPDIFVCAKALANGFPIGACIANDKVAEAFAPGAHGSTFGGGPVAATAALATLNFLEPILEHIPSKSAQFKEGLSAISGIKGVRGEGLMLGAVLEEPRSAEIAAKCFELGLIVNNVREDTIRLTPPLVISEAQIREACSLIEKAITDG